MLPKPGSPARGPVWPKPLDARHHQPRLLLGELLVAEAPLVEAAGREVLEHDVARQRQAADHRPALGAAEVDGHEPLVPREGRPPDAPAVDEHAPAAHRVAGLRALDLDDLGPEVGEQLTGERAGHEAAELEDADAAQRAVAVQRHEPSTNGKMRVKSVPGSAVANRSQIDATTAPTDAGPRRSSTARR